MVHSIRSHVLLYYTHIRGEPEQIYYTLSFPIWPVRVPPFVLWMDEIVWFYVDIVLMCGARARTTHKVLKIGTSAIIETEKWQTHGE